MGYASLNGRARTDVNNPIAQACCDRCGFWYSHNMLNWQYEYRGRTLQNIRILVCEICTDKPNEQLKPRIIPPDPVPIANARVEPFAYDSEDHRGTSNPALPNVDLASTANILLSGFQFINGVQADMGNLVLVMGQTDSSKNGIYKVSSGVWSLQGYDNDRKVFYDFVGDSTTEYWELGYNYGAVNVARGERQYIKLYQIIFSDPSATIVSGAPVLIGPVNPSNVNHYDFFTGIYMAGADIRITQTSDVRTPQQTGAASGSLNEIPGYSNLVPGSCDIGIPTSVPYGNASKQGIPSGFTKLPFAGPLWPSIQNQSIGYWLNQLGQPTIWQSNSQIELTFSTNIWPEPGPGAAWRPIGFGIDNHPWVNNIGLQDFWNNAANQPINWRQGEVYGILPPGGDILWKDEKCVLSLWNNNAKENVNWAEVYPNGLPKHIYPDGPPPMIPSGN